MHESVLDAYDVRSISNCHNAYGLRHERTICPVVFHHQSLLRQIHAPDQYPQRRRTAPRKAKNPDRPQPRRPDWLRVKAPVSKAYNETRKLMRKHNLVTVCEEAACPNIGECWSQKHATMMILGSVCTRACAFCNVATGRPDLLDPT